MNAVGDEIRRRRKARRAPVKGWTRAGIESGRTPGKWLHWWFPPEGGTAFEDEITAEDVEGVGDGRGVGVG